MKLRTCLTGWAVCLGLAMVAQTTGSLLGRVSDPAAGPIADAVVHAMSADTAYTTGTGADGTYRFAALPTGSYRVRVSHVSYRPQEIAEAWVRAGRSEWVEFTMERAVQELAQVEVRSVAPQRMEAMDSEPLTVERSLRFPATFHDPARLAMSYAGVVTTNDEANHFSVRGTAPWTNAWLLEGVEIVTPNHLTNAGTSSDQPTLTGGGTTILSAQMLGRSQLLLGGASAQYGNALGGIMDLRLRQGTNERRAYTAQAGLIGLDLSAEGPFRTGGKATYLVNYRYSTLGLLSAAGVPLGDENIAFQDLAFTVHAPLGERAELKLFAMGGNSSNRFDRKDSTEWEVDKDSRNIDYTARVGVAGVSFMQRLGRTAKWTTVLALSANEQDRTVEYAPYRRQAAFTDATWLYERKVSAHSAVVGTVSARSAYRVGITAMERDLGKRFSPWSERYTGWLVRPYGEFRYHLTEALRMDVGLAYAADTRNGTGAVEPRLAVRWSITESAHLAVAIGQRSQLPRAELYFETGPLPYVDNRNLAPILAREASITYQHDLRPQLRLHGTVYLQRFLNVPVYAPSPGLWPGYTPSLLNAWDGVTMAQLSGTGTGDGRGVELGLERRFQGDLFFLVNGTWMDPRYTDSDGATQRTRWNVGHVANAVVGKEWAKEKEHLERTWGLSLRANATGGQRYTPIASSEDPRPAPFSAQYRGTYRVDVRLYLKRERPGRTGIWAVDLLNATNAKNEAYRYFDQHQGQVVTRYQLGLIPNLSYRIEF